MVRLRRAPATRGVHWSRREGGNRPPSAAWRASGGRPRIPGSTASLPASGSRRMLEKKPEAALLGKPGRMQIVGSRMPMPSMKPAARIVGEQEFADRLLGAVTQQRRLKEFVADGLRKRCAEYRDRGSEHDPRFVAAANEPDSIQQHPRAVEIDPVALVEIEFSLAGDDRRQMKDHIGPIRDQLCGRTRYGEVGGHGIDRKSRVRRFRRRDHVVQG